MPPGTRIIPAAATSFVASEMLKQIEGERLVMVKVSKAADMRKVVVATTFWAANHRP